MADTLYTREILRLAMSLASDSKMVDPDGTSNIRSDVCGSEVAVQIKLDAAEKIEKISISAKACAMGQASAAIVKRHAIGKTQFEISVIEEGLSRFLDGKSAMPTDWPELGELVPARHYTARHSAILLPYKALLVSFADAGKTKAA